MVPGEPGHVLNAAVLGSPIAHSLSPVLHRAAYRALGLREWRYAAHEVDEEGFLPFVAGLDETWRGLSLTMPLKEVAFEVAADISPTALATGAVNTLVRRETGEWDAHNTDVHGVVAALGGSLRDAAAARARQRCSARVPRPARRSPHWPNWVCAASARGPRCRAPATTRIAADLGLQVEQVSLERWAERGGLS